VSHWSMHDSMRGRRHPRHSPDAFFTSAEIDTILFTCENKKVIAVKIEVTLPGLFSRLVRVHERALQ
jgi:hypothetical protein